MFTEKKTNNIQRKSAIKDLGKHKGRKSKRSVFGALKYFWLVLEL